MSGGGIQAQASPNGRQGLFPSQQPQMPPQAMPQQQTQGDYITNPYPSMQTQQVLPPAFNYQSNAQKTFGGDAAQSYGAVNPLARIMQQRGMFQQNGPDVASGAQKGGK